MGKPTKSARDKIIIAPTVCEKYISTKVEKSYFTGHKETYYILKLSGFLGTKITQFLDWSSHTDALWELAVGSVLFKCSIR